MKTTLKNFYRLLHPVHNFKFPVKTLKFLFVFSIFSLLAIGFSTYWFLFKDLPPLHQLTTAPLPQTTHIRDRHGTSLYKIYSNQNRTIISLSDLPPHVTQAFIAIEDRNFYNHKGFSLKGIARAAVVNLKNFAANCKFKTADCDFIPIQGGSTISQQLVKTSLLTPDRTFERKLKELFLSVYIENRLSKNQILELYLNRIGFGGAVYGLEEAAQTYFGIPAQQLSLAQAALLAGLPAAPTIYSPYGAHPEQTKHRQQEVLRHMAEAGFITWDQATSASAQTLTFKNPAQNLQAPHFVMYVKELLAQKYGSQAVEEGGLEVTTTLDLPFHTQVEKIVADETAKVAYLKISNGAALVTHPATGEIIAMVGSRNYFDLQNDGNVNVVLRPRQPGSSIKPLNYALAFESWLTPATLLDDIPTTYNFPDQPPYSPVNYDHRYHGKVTARVALASSYNIPAVQVLNHNGLQSFIEFARTLGITTWTDPSRYGLSLTLGGGEVTMFDLASAYGVFANLGQKIALNPILEVKDSQGRILERHPCYEAIIDPTSSTSCSSTPVLDPRIAYQITDILSDNSARTPTFGANSQLYIPRQQVAVKTGTTNNLRDNWTIGYTPTTLVAVWVGNNDNSPMSYVASGVTGASPIWRQIINTQISDSHRLAFAKPAGLESRTYGCQSRSDYFLPGTLPNYPCPTQASQPPSSSPTPNPSLPRRIFRFPRRSPN